MEKGDCVLNSLTPEEIQDVLDQVVQDMTDRIAGIRLCKQDKILSDDICTVHTTFEGNYHTRENVPVIFYSRSFFTPKKLPELSSLGAIGATIADNFNIEKTEIGISVLDELE